METAAAEVDTKEGTTGRGSTSSNFSGKETSFLDWAAETTAETDDAEAANATTPAPEPEASTATGTGKGRSNNEANSSGARREATDNSFLTEPQTAN